MARGNFISYLRVSTNKQGISGLGLEAQREAVSVYLNGGKWNLVKEVVEVESGKRNDRPSLAEAMRLCKKHKATLIIAKLDRLARNVHFISGLMESGVDFVACDMPEANKLILHVMAAFAEHEADAISKRTVAALAAAKARGIQLGGLRTSIERSREIAAAAREANSEKAAEARARVLPIIEQLQAEGATTLRAIAAGLNQQEVPAPRGGEWSAVQVMRVMRPE
jgi:DNA invertase Pin-like site-specific DNA recombinase